MPTRFFELLRDILPTTAHSSFKVKAARTETVMRPVDGERAPDVALATEAGE